jgi:hypothetical protein
MLYKNRPLISTVKIVDAKMVLYFHVLKSTVSPDSNSLEVLWLNNPWLGQTMLELF